jgi:hypothetical protein
MTPDKRKEVNSLYSRNRSVYNQFIQKVKEKNIKKFNSQNELYCFIEDIKNPRLHRRRSGTKPYYAGRNNYGPIIDHLINDSIIGFMGNINNRYVFKVLLLPANELAISANEKNINLSKNYSPEVNKIDNLNGPEMIVDSKTSSLTNKRLDEILKLTIAESQLSSAIQIISKINTDDKMMNARIYNLQVLAVDIANAISEKQTFLINQRYEIYI